jgi:hypothetical protein
MIQNLRILEELKTAETKTNHDRKTWPSFQPTFAYSTWNNQNHLLTKLKKDKKN